MPILSTPILNKTEKYVTKVYVNEFSDKFIFHDLKYIHRIVDETEKIAISEGLSESDIEILLLVAWFYYVGFKDFDAYEKAKEPTDIFVQCKKCSMMAAKAFLEKEQYPPEKIEKTLKILDKAFPDNEPHLQKGGKLENIVVDAIRMDFGRPKGKKRAKLLYEEFLLLGTLNFGKRGWYEAMIEYLTNFDYTTKYGKKHFSPNKKALLIKLQKEYKEVKKEDDIVLRKELGINEEELKALKKNLRSVKGRDERGIQTIFRTTSKNHYTLNEMVDKKANIMISVNSIILSLIIGGIITPNIEFNHSAVPLLIMTLTSIFSVIFAILSIRPDTTHGEFTEKDIRNKKGNLLFFGNFHKMQFKDYEWGMLQMLNDSNYMYSTLIRDIYFLGQTLGKKYKYIRLSLTVFMVGITLTVLSFFLYHFGWILF